MGPLALRGRVRRGHRLRHVLLAQGLTFDADEIGRLGLAPTMVMMDRPGHTVSRRLVNQRFTPRRVRTLEPWVRALVRARIERIAETGETDLVAELADPLPNAVVAHYLGVPEADHHRFGDRAWRGRSAR